MKSVIDELVTVLGIDVSPESMASVQKMTGMLEGVIKSAATVAGVITAAASAIMVFADEMNQSAGQLARFSDVTGISTGNLQELMYAAEAAGGNAKSLQNDLMGLTKSMSSPIPGEYNRNLMFLGISVRNASGQLKTADELLESIANRLQGMDKITQLQWASKLGISNDTLRYAQLPREERERLRKESESIPTIVDEKAIRNAYEFTVQLTLLRRMFAYLGETVSSIAGPILTELVAQLRDWLKENREIIELGIGNVLKGIVKGFELFKDALTVIWKMLSTIAPWLKNVASGFTNINTVAKIVAISLGALLAAFIAANLEFVAIATTIMIVVTAIQSLIDWIYALPFINKPLSPAKEGSKEAEIKKRPPNWVLWLSTLSPLLSGLTKFMVAGATVPYQIKNANNNEDNSRTTTTHVTNNINIKSTDPVQSGKETVKEFNNTLQRNNPGGYVPVAQ